MRALFLPVWSSGILNRVWRWVPKTRPPTWFDDKPIGYPHGLFSYVDWRSYKDALIFPKGTHIFGDSGGFTLISKPNEVLDPVEVLQWQMATCSVGAILDRPPRRTTRTVIGANQTDAEGSGRVHTVEYRDWQECLRFTIRNIERALPTYLNGLEKGSDYRWWGVLHGNNEDEAREWYAALTAIYPFDGPGEGWAVYPGPQAHPFTVARTMRILQSLGIKRAHFLACTGQDVIATILALGPKAGLEFVTFDSMSFAVAAINRWWFTAVDDHDQQRMGRSSLATADTPVAAGKKAASQTFFEFENVRCLDTLAEQFCDACPCDVCQFLRTGSDTPWLEKEPPGGWRDASITLHNLHMQRTCIDRQTKRAAADPVAFLNRVLGAKVASKTFRIFEGQESEHIVRTGSNLGLLAGL